MCVYVCLTCMHVPRHAHSCSSMCVYYNGIFFEYERACTYHIYTFTYTDLHPCNEKKIYTQTYICIILVLMYAFIGTCVSAQE